MKFSFGRNWLSYSESALTPEKVDTAREAFHALMRGIELSGARFLNIGFGQGLPLFLAAEAGADVHGIDLDPMCAKAVEATHRFFPGLPVPKITIASILDDSFVRIQRDEGGFDVVHTWGVLHHTGAMDRAFRNAAAMVKPGGFLVISIYNRHWTSPIWVGIKYCFNLLPRFLQTTATLVSYPLFYLRARGLAGGRQEVTHRGMNLFHDVQDWLGGHPYEYASAEEMEQTFAALGFVLVRCNRTEGYTGCNEFVFRKRGEFAENQISSGGDL